MQDKNIKGYIYLEEVEEKLKNRSVKVFHTIL